MPVIWGYLIVGIGIGMVLGVGLCTFLVWLENRKIRRNIKQARKNLVQILIQSREKLEAAEKEMAGMAKTTEKFRHKADWN